MSRYPLFNRSRFELRRLAERGHDMTVEQLLPLARPQSSFPHLEFDEFTSAIVAARESGRPAVVMMGRHPIKLGLLRFPRKPICDSIALLLLVADIFHPCPSVSGLR